MANKYHVFLSYNSSMYEEAASIYGHLADSGFRVFFDRKCMRHEVFWQKEIDKALKASDAVLVVIGPNGLGPWREEGNYPFQLISGAAPESLIIPVFLPGAVIPDDYPPFLHRYHHFSFRSSVSDELYGLTRMFLKESEAEKHGNPFVQEESLSRSTREFYKANAEIYLNEWRGPVPAEIYPWFFLIAGR